MVKLFHPISFCLTKLGLQSLQESPVGNFALAISLEMPHWSESLKDAKLLVELVEPGTAKLATIIDDYHPGETISADDRLPHEVLHQASIMRASGSTSTHLMKKSIATNKNLCYPIARGNGLKMSTPHWMKGHGATIRVRCNISWH